MCTAYRAHTPIETYTYYGMAMFCGVYFALGRQLSSWGHHIVVGKGPHHWNHTCGVVKVETRSLSCLSGHGK